MTQTIAARKKSKIFLVDDHPVMRQGLARLLNQEQDIVVCGEAGDALDALKMIPQMRPDLAMVDISLKGVGGIDLIKGLKARHAKIPVLVLSMHDESLYAERVLRAGALGYIMKQEPTEKVLLAIRTVLKGRVYVSPEIETRVLGRLVERSEAAAASPLEQLSNRELEVFWNIGQGRSTKQIADELSLSIKTIETYRANIKQKLDLQSTSELMKHAICWAEMSRSN